jgi:hypothetical protein
VVVSDRTVQHNHAAFGGSREGGTKRYEPGLSGALTVFAPNSRGVKCVALVTVALGDSTVRFSRCNVPAAAHRIRSLRRSRRPERIDSPTPRPG